MSQKTYPPCDTFFCSTRQCCARGHKFEWPNLVGTDPQQAKVIIEHDNPYVTVVFIKKGELPYTNFCCNRVVVFLDENGKVSSAPSVPVVG
ncbi:hypothetical protein CDL12_21237 [Handroanthus impetiginosus]|uniref:Uncharacterized protein n=1 Tax=Handroanthus impetiginosus TaxID=429701 RepID=A0A2G9GLT0_9LAMI|nr:hypothetical protein CDL12_21237 [Handroanthus impetiginosus]